MRCSTWSTTPSMSTRSSGGFSARRNVAGGLVIAAALSLSASPPALAQQLRQQLEKLTETEPGRKETEIDAVTRAIREDPLGPVRLAAYSLEQEDDRGKAVHGVIRSE